jgi:amino-acid N-acetyltransferase
MTMTAAVASGATATLDAPPIFRTATAHDAAAVERLLTEVGLPTAGVGALLATDASPFLVAVSPSDPDDVVAVAGLEVRGENALLRSVAVRSDWQRLGLGHELIRRLVCEAEGRGIRALYLLTMTAELYFPRFGFSHVAKSDVPGEIADTLEFRSACPATATAMRRVLEVEGTSG